MPKGFNCFIKRYAFRSLILITKLALILPFLPFSLISFIVQTKKISIYLSENIKNEMNMHLNSSVMNNIENEKPNNLF